MIMKIAKSCVVTLLYSLILAMASIPARAGSATDYDCIVYKCITSEDNPIPREYYRDDQYICEHGGAMCEEFPVPGAPEDCPPIRVCFFDSTGYTKTTYHCTTDHLGEWPLCPNAERSHYIMAFLNSGESVGPLTETIRPTISPEYRIRRAITCAQGSEYTVLVCPIPEWLMELIESKKEAWEQGGEVETHTYVFTCTEEGCQKSAVTY